MVKKSTPCCRDSEFVNLDFSEYEYLTALRGRRSKIMNLWTFSVGEGGGGDSTPYHSCFFFFLSSHQLFLDENSERKNHNLTPNSDHLTPKLINFIWKSYFSQKWQSRHFLPIVNMLRVAGIRFQKKVLPKCMGGRGLVHSFMTSFLDGLPKMGLFEKLSKLKCTSNLLQNNF